MKVGYLGGATVRPAGRDMTWHTPSQGKYLIFQLSPCPRRIRRPYSSLQATIETPPVNSSSLLALFWNLAVHGGGSGAVHSGQHLASIKSFLCTRESRGESFRETCRASPSTTDPIPSPSICMSWSSQPDHHHENGGLSESQLSMQPRSSHDNQVSA